MINDELHDLKRKVDGLAAWQQSFAKDVDKLQTMATGTAMTKSVATKFDSLSKRIKTLEVTKNSGNAGTSVQQRFDEVDSRINEVARQLHEKGVGMPAGDIVELEVTQAKNLARVANQDKLSRDSNVLVSMSACVALVIEPLSFFLTNPVASYIAGAIAILLLIVSIRVRPSGGNKRDAKENLAESNIRLNYAYADRERQKEIGS